MISFKYLVARS